MTIMGRVVLKVQTDTDIVLLVSEVIWAATTWVFLNPRLLLESGANIAAALRHDHVWVLADRADFVRRLVPSLDE